MTRDGKDVNTLWEQLGEKYLVNVLLRLGEKQRQFFFKHLPDGDSWQQLWNNRYEREVRL